MGDFMSMSEKERSRKAVMEAVRLKYCDLRQAAEAMELSYRQTKRIWKRYREEHDAGLVHQSRGKASNRKLTDSLRQSVIARYKERYYDFKPTFALEKLTKDGFSLSVETLRKWLKEEGLWHTARKRKKAHKMRERKPRFGELIQIDGSTHDWFESGKKSCLLNMVDDATGTTLALLDTGETTKVLLQCLWIWIEKYGIPVAVYVDLKSVYISPKSLKGQQEDDTQLQEGQSVFERVCKALGIIVIRAYSPQAKGRVERKHSVYQDRFIKELRLLEIQDAPNANEFLLGEYLDELNRKFAVEPALPEEAHRSTAGYNLKNIFCWEFKRVVRNDGVIRFCNLYYQLSQKAPVVVRPKKTVLIKKHLDGTLSIWYKNVELIYTMIGPAPKNKGQPPKFIDLKSITHLDEYDDLYFDLCHPHHKTKEKSDH